MTETLTKKKTAFDVWLEALRSGEYEQGLGTLCSIDDAGTKRYCCVGVLDEAVFHTTWTPFLSNNYILQDADGYTHNLSSESPKARSLGLHKKLTPGEVALLVSYAPAISTDDSRLAALAQLNDAGCDFDTIAMLMENTLEWNKDDN